MTGQKYCTNYGDVAVKMYEWCIKRNIFCQCENNPSNRVYTIILSAKHQKINEFFEKEFEIFIWKE